MNISLGETSGRSHTEKCTLKEAASAPVSPKKVVGCRGGNRYVEGDLLTIGELMLDDTFPSLTIGYLVFDDSLS